MISNLCLCYQLIFITSLIRWTHGVPIPGSAYHNYDQMTQLLHRLAADYPQIAHLHSIGKSIQGRDMWVLCIAGSHPNQHLLFRPEVALMANMHGNEVVGKELLLYLATDLLSRYEEDKNVTHLLDTRRIHLIPSLNPDGLVAARGEGDCDQARNTGRYNAHNIDLNRNFVSRMQDLGDDLIGPALQPETVAVMQWLNTVPLVLAANLHGGALVANYPWDGNPEDRTAYTATPDDDVFRYLSLLYSNTHTNMHLGIPCPNGDEDKFPEGVTNGAEWYAIDGSLQDYQYAFHGTMALTLEVSCCKYPASSSLQQHWMDNRPPLMAFLEHGDKGVRGVVVDSDGVGIPNVELMVHGRAIRFHTNYHGEFFRFLLPDDYILTVESEGYVPTVVPFTVPSPGAHPPYGVVNITLKEEPETIVTYPEESAEAETLQPPAAPDLENVQSKIREKIHAKDQISQLGSSKEDGTDINKPNMDEILSNDTKEQEKGVTEMEEMTTDASLGIDEGTQLQQLVHNSSAFYYGATGIYYRFILSIIALSYYFML